MFFALKFYKSYLGWWWGGGGVRYIFSKWHILPALLVSGDRAVSANVWVIDVIIVIKYMH